MFRREAVSDSQKEDVFSRRLGKSTVISNSFEPSLEEIFMFLWRERKELLGMNDLPTLPGYTEVKLSLTANQQPGVQADQLEPAPSQFSVWIQTPAAFMPVQPPQLLCASRVCQFESVLSAQNTKQRYRKKGNNLSPLPPCLCPGGSNLSLYLASPPRAFSPPDGNVTAWATSPRTISHS